jgi:ATP-dependent RNA circularization protein (DNA/RNA ligase family)
MYGVAKVDSTDLITLLASHHSHVGAYFARNVLIDMLIKFIKTRSFQRDIHTIETGTCSSVV